MLLIPVATALALDALYSWNIHGTRWCMFPGWPTVVYLPLYLPKHSILRFGINLSKVDVFLCLKSLLMFGIQLILTFFSAWGFQQEARPHWPLCKWRQQVFHLLVLCLQRCRMVHTWPIRCELYISMYAGHSQVTHSNANQIGSLEVLLKTTGDGRGNIIDIDSYGIIFLYVIIYLAPHSDLIL